MTGQELRDYLRKAYSQIVERAKIVKAVRYVQRYRINVLAYHNIAHRPDPLVAGLPNVSPEVFESQVSFMSENYNILSVAQLLTSLNSGNFPQRAVVLTFDDGLRSVFENALPILQKYSVPATIYLTTDLLDNNNLSWRSKLEYILAQGQGLNFIKILKTIYLQEETASLTLEKLKRWTILHFNRDLINQALNQIFALLGWNETELAQNAQLYFNVNDLLQVDNELIEFGNHTRSHPVLSRLSAEQQRDEIIGAFRCLERHLGCRKFSFAYPFGALSDYTKETQKICRDSGHYCSFNVSGKAISPRDVSIFDLSRKGVPALEPPMLQSFLEDILPSQIFLRAGTIKNGLKRPKEKA